MWSKSAITPSAGSTSCGSIPSSTPWTATGRPPPTASSCSAAPGRRGGSPRRGSGPPARRCVRYPPGMHPSAERVADVLRELGVSGQVRELPEPAPTAVAAASQLGCEVGAIANSLVFSADGAPLLVLTSGAHRVDTARVAGLIGASQVARADARSVREWTGQAIGGGAPGGHPRPITTLVDPRRG